MREEGFALPARFIPARQSDGAFLDILGADLDAQGHAAHLPIVELESGRYLGAIIHFDTHPGGFELGLDPANGLHDSSGLRV